MRFITILIIFFLGLIYTNWRIWTILPLPALWKWGFTFVWILCFALIFIHYGLGNRLPLWLAAASYEASTSWIIAFIYVLMLFAGDVLDGALRPVREWDYASILRRLNAPVYACPGNHEYISGKDEAFSFLKDAGIHLLVDSSAEVCGTRIIGRDDRSNRGRKPLAGLAPADSVFTILLDHQPYNLEEAENCGIDFQFSGHTHHGQIWPGNWITDAMYEKAFGRHHRGTTQYYISSGLGIWGGKFRIGTRSEYIVLKIKG